MTKPQLEDTVYHLAATNQAIYAARASGVYRSRDDGKTWQNSFVAAPELNHVTATAVAATNETVFAGIEGAIAVSNDAGTNWQLVPLATPAPLVTDIHISKNFSDDQFAAVATAEDGVFITEDGGSNWVAWNFGLFDANISSLICDTNGTLLVGAQSGIFHSHNSGKSWRELTFPVKMAPVVSLATISTLIFVGTQENGLFVSNDRGKMWSPVASAELKDQPIQALIAEASHLTVLTDHQLIQLRLDDNSLQVLTQFAESYAVTFTQTKSHKIIGLANGDIDIH